MTYNILLCAKAFSRMASFEKKPDSGGIPAMARQPITKVYQTRKLFRNLFF